MALEQKQHNWCPVVGCHRYGHFRRVALKLKVTRTGMVTGFRLRISAGLLCCEIFLRIHCKMQIINVRMNTKNQLLNGFYYQEILRYVFQLLIYMYLRTILRFSRSSRIHHQHHGCHQHQYCHHPHLRAFFLHLALQKN